MASDLESGPARQLCRSVPSHVKDPPVTLATGDLAGNVEPLAFTAPEDAEKDETASRAKVEGVEAAAAATEEVESPEGAGPGGKVVAPEGAAVMVEASENPEAERVAEAFAQAAERFAISEVAKVLQSAIAELKEKRRNASLKPRNTTQEEEEEDLGERGRGEMKWRGGVLGHT
ncbi:uncharacterized protein VSU04_008376 isoform 1-T1 [Chlamydotis macqueenii]